MIGFDASGLICLIEHREPAFGLIREFLASGDPRIVLASVIVTECLAKPIEVNDVGLIARYHAFFDLPTTTVSPLQRSMALDAARLRARFGLKTVDALHLATAIAAGASDFVTTDRLDFARCRGHVRPDVHILPRLPDRP